MSKNPARGIARNISRFLGEFKKSAYSSRENHAAIPDMNEA